MATKRGRQGPETLKTIDPIERLLMAVVEQARRDCAWNELFELWQSLTSEPPEPETRRGRFLANRIG
jgi:hypothetical protein